MVSDVYLKNYVLFLFMGITILFIFMKLENKNSNKFSFDLKISKIQNSRKNLIQYEPKLLKFKSIDSRNLENINFQVSNIE